MPESNLPLSRREVLGGAGAVYLQAAKSRPNFLYIHSHDTGRYIQPYGYAVATPNLQKLAEGGVLFRQAHNAAPTCSPSRASLLTGCCPHRNGMLGLAHRGFSLSDYRQHIVNTLRPAGYRSALIGLQHIARDPKAIGYDEVATVQGNRAVKVAPAAVEWLKRRPKEPFFLTVGFFETHREFPPGNPEEARYTMPPAPIADTPQTRLDMAGFKASARIMDNAVGQVLEALESAGLAENTVVISTTDHGIAFPGMKCNLTGHGTGVSLILRGPSGFSGGKVSDALVSHLDLYPTVCDLAGVPHPSWIEGQSLLPLVRGEKSEVREELFAEVNYHAAYEPARGARTRQWSYVCHIGDRSRPVLPNCDDSPSKDLWLEHGWRDRPVAHEELYDLTFDPQERRTVAADPAMKQALSEMRGRMDRWMNATDDPALKGRIPAPEGALVNDVDGVSPRDQPGPVRRP